MSTDAHDEGVSEDAPAAARELHGMRVDEARVSLDEVCTCRCECIGRALGGLHLLNHVMHPCDRARPAQLRLLPIDPELVGSVDLAQQPRRLG